MKTVKIYGKFVSDFFVLLQNRKGPQAFVSILWSRSQKSVSKFRVFFLIPFRLVKLFIIKKRPNGVSFKLFLDSLNMKRLSSTCLLHTCKSVWRVVSPTVGYLFFSSDRLFTKEHSIQPWLEEFSRVLFYTFSGPRDHNFIKNDPLESSFVSV